MPVIYFTVTNDLTYDQRMIRICTSLSNAGYSVILIGRKTKQSLPLAEMPFKQKRLNCFFTKGKLFYAAYNIRLFIFLLFKKMDGICAIDLDSILPCLFISKLKNIPRIYDAHELFCEMKEVATRPGIYRIWKWIEKKSVPQFKYAYTVNQLIANEFRQLYKTDFKIIRSISVYDPNKINEQKEEFILYQGAVNEGRSFETLIPAMQLVNCKLIICGDGNFMEEAKLLVKNLHLEDKIIFKGMLVPSELKVYTSKAYIGITLFEKDARSNYYSLANRFFDYIHAGTPQLCVAYPIYEELNNLHHIAVLVNNLSPEMIAENLNKMLSDESLWQKLHENCKEAAKELCWQNEEQKLISFYKNIFG